MIMGAWTIDNTVVYDYIKHLFHHLLSKSPAILEHDVAMSLFHVRLLEMLLKYFWHFLWHNNGKHDSYIPKFSR